MQKIHTHYDNLKVARNAPLEVIRAAYKILSQKHHPDKNSHNSNASNNMAIINASYEVLSDPVKRKQHDAWIAEKEAVSRVNSQPAQSDRATYKTKSKAQSKSASTTFGSFMTHIRQFWFLYGLLVIAYWNLAVDDNSPPAGPKQYNANPISDDKHASIRNPYKRPLYAPNGEDWPYGAGYVRGYKSLNSNGLSSVSVDNTQNDSDVFVKLVSLEDAEAYPVRHFLIPANAKFTVTNIDAGRYDIRYRDLESGDLSRSESFNLVETKIDGGTQFSNYTITLYKVRNGNMQTYGLSEAEF